MRRRISGPLLSAVIACVACATDRPPDPALPLASPAPASTLSAEGTASLEPADARELACNVLSRFDADRDLRLTTLDQGDPSSWPRRIEHDGIRIEFQDIQAASRWVQAVFGQLRLHPARAVALDGHALGSSAADFLLEQIQTRYWRGLSRVIRADDSLFEGVLADDKVGGQRDSELELCGVAELGLEPRSESTYHLYVPRSDPENLAVFGEFAKQTLTRGGPKLVVGSVPENAGAAFVDELTKSDAHGLLLLEPGKPFVVPGGRFNEMYGWDSYFIGWGLSASPGYDAEARAMAEQQRYEIVHYGKVLNANRSYYLTRSQPPFFTRLVERVFAAAPPSFRDSAQGEQWLRSHFEAAVSEYEAIWSKPPRLTSVCREDTCLARYYGTGRGQPPEVEAGHFDWMYQRVALEAPRCSKLTGADFVTCARDLERRYREGTFVSKELDAFFVHDRCMRESGHDTSYRWFDLTGDRCADFASVDLNVLLLQYELDLAAWAARFAQAEQRDVYCKKANARAALLNDYSWDEQLGLYLDWDVRRGGRHHYVAATTLYPLWVEVPNACGVSVVPEERAERLVNHALQLLEAPGGLYASARKSVAATPKVTRIELRDGVATEVVVGRQWDYPNGWAPHQMIAWQGLTRHGFHAEAQRLMYKWLYTIARSAADYHGTVPEKFNAATRSHQVFEEYGNVSTDFSYITEEGFGWMNASYVIGFQALDSEHREALRHLVPPEELQEFHAPQR